MSQGPPKSSAATAGRFFSQQPPSAPNSQSDPRLPLLSTAHTVSSLRPLLNAIHLGSCFFLVFTAFSGISSIESTLLFEHHIGFYAIATLYFVFAAACLVAPVIVQRLSARLSIPTAFLCFTVFCAANVYATLKPSDSTAVWVLLLAASALTGFAASFLWTAQAAYLTACANEYALALGRAKPSALGMFSGIFFAAFQMSQVTGNFLESVVLPHTSRTVLFTTYLACAGVGLVCSAFLRRLLPPPSSYVHAIHSNTGPNRRSAQRGTRIGRLLDSNNGASLDSRDSHDVTTTGLTSGPASTGSGYGSGSESGSHSSAAISAARLPINSGLVHNPAGLVVSVRSLTSARGSCGGGVTPSSNGGGFVVHSNQHHGHALTQSTDSLVIPVTFGGDGSAFAPIPTTITPHSGDDSWDDVSLGLNTPPHSQQQLQPAPTRVSTTVTAASGASHGPRSTFFATLALWKDPRMLCLVPLMCLSGVEQGWSSGTFTRSYVAPSIGVENIGYVLAVYGLVNAAASGFVGKLSDCCGRVASLVLGFVSQGSVVAVLLFGSVDPASSMALVVSAGAWGLGDAVWNTQLYALLGDMFDTAIEPAFTNFKLVQSLLQGAAWVLGAQLGHHRNTYLYALAGLLVASPLLAALAVHIHRSTRGAK